MEPEPEPERAASSARQLRVEALGAKPVSSAHVGAKLPAPQSQRALFRRMDVNGNGGLSVAEIDKSLVDGSLGAALGDGSWKAAKPVILRAYKAADISGDGFIERREFGKLLQYLVYFDRLWDAFTAIDTDDDRRLTLPEFRAGCAAVGIPLAAREAAQEFAICDANAGGFVLFGEFCTWAAKRHYRAAGSIDDEDETGDEGGGSRTDAVTTTTVSVDLSASGGQFDAEVELSATEQEEILHKIYSTLLRQAGLNDGEPSASEDPSARSLADLLETHIDLAEACRVQRSWAGAAEAYEKALAIAQSDDVGLAPEDVAELHNRRGMVLHQLGDEEGAVVAYTAGIATTAAAPRATLYCHRGFSRSRIGQMAAAEKDLLRAVELGGSAPDERAVAELAQVSKARRAGLAPSAAASKPRGTPKGKRGGRAPELMLPHGLTPPMPASSPDSLPRASPPPGSGYGKVSPRTRTKVSAQEARTKANVCAATGQTIMPAARGQRLLQEISSVATRYDDVELTALAKAALSEREEATGKWRRELARLRGQSKRQKEEIAELKMAKEAMAAHVKQVKRQQDERVEAVRRNSEGLLQEDRQKQRALARKRAAEANANSAAILTSAMKNARKLMKEAALGNAMRDDVLARFDGLVAGVEEAVLSSAPSPGVRSPSPGRRSPNGGSSPGAGGGERNGGGHRPKKVWHNDSILAGSQTSLGVYSSDRKVGRPSPSKAVLGPPPTTRTAVLLGLHDGAEVPAQQQQASPSGSYSYATPVPVRVSVDLSQPDEGEQLATPSGIILTAAEQEAATEAVAAREAEWAAAAVKSFSSAYHLGGDTSSAAPQQPAPKAGQLSLEEQMAQFEDAKARWDALQEPAGVAASPRSPAAPVRPARRSDSSSMSPRKQASPRKSPTQTSESTAKLMLSHDVLDARTKLRAMSYTSHGQDPHSLLSMYDKDRSGELSWEEFKAAVRKGGKVKADGPQGITDAKLRKLFVVVDKDSSGTVSIAEMTTFVWGNTNLLHEHDGTAISSTAAEHAALSAKELSALHISTAALYSALTIPNGEPLDAFDRCDTTGSGRLALAEADKAVMELWPNSDHKKALMRAFKAADTSGDGYIERDEFPLLLKYIVYFNNWWAQFDKIDKDHDGRLDVNELHRGCKLLGLDVSWATTMEEFNTMDDDCGGYVRFDEFCAWCAKRVHAEFTETHRQEEEALVVESVEDDAQAERDVFHDAHRHVAAASGSPAAPIVQHPPLTMPDKQGRKALYNRMDVNGNGGLSLADIDKSVVEGLVGSALGCPDFNHKPALIRAYKAADTSGDGFIERNEFAKLLRFIVYFNNLWHKFEEVDSDHDRRIDAQEFAAGCTTMGMSLSDEEAAAQFAECDTDGGGMIMFGEFCAWCAEQEHRRQEELEPAVEADLAEVQAETAAQAEAEALAEAEAEAKAEALAADGAEEGADDEQIMRVICPEGCGPGDVVLIATASGDELEVEVPEGISAGEEFEVYLS